MKTILEFDSADEDEVLDAAKQINALLPETTGVVYKNPEFNFCPEDIMTHFHLGYDEGVKSERERVVGEIKSLIQVDEIQPPRLYQANPTRNSMGGYSSVPFYCSLCGMGEMDIQDNKMDDGNYKCNCSVWTNSCGGEWVRWLNGVKEAQKMVDKYMPNPYNQALSDAISKIKEEC